MIALFHRPFPFVLPHFHLICSRFLHSHLIILPPILFLSLFDFFPPFRVQCIPQSIIDSQFALIFFSFGHCFALCTFVILFLCGFAPFSCSFPHSEIYF